MKNLLKPTLSVIALALLLFLLFVAITRAQQPAAVTTFESFAPTATGANVCGQVTTAVDVGIRNAYLTLTSSGGEIRNAITSTSGFYCFNDLPAGESYVLTVHSKRFSFDPASVIISLNDDLTDVSFVALP